MPINNGQIPPKFGMFRGEVKWVSDHRGERMVNVTATLPILMLEKIDELVREGRISSRSRFIREAVKNYFRTSNT